MLEISWTNKRKKIRTVFWAGHGMPSHGQVWAVSLVREDLSDLGDQVLNAQVVFAL
jgi:hypothetical protein